MAKRKPKKKTDYEPPTLVAYWDKLTEGEIMQINNAVTYYFKRNNPGVLPFTSMASICMALMSYVRTLDDHRAVYYRLLHKLESHKHQAVRSVTQGTTLRIPASRLLKLVPARMRTHVNHSVFKFRLPFATKSWATAHVMSDDVVQFESAPKHVMPLRAWLELT